LSKRVAEFGCKLAAFDGSGALAKFACLLWTALLAPQVRH
jgi:hypothetical protein